MCTPCDCTSGFVPKDQHLSNVSASKNISACRIVARDAIFSTLTVNNNPFTSDYNQIQAISTLAPNNFAVIYLPSGELNIRQGDPTNAQEWNIFGPQIVYGGVVAYVPVTVPFIQWTDVFIPNTGTYELHFASSYIPNFGGVFGGLVDGVVQLPGVDFSVVPAVPPAFQNEVKMSLGNIVAGIHDIGIQWISNGSIGNATFMQIFDIIRLVQIA